MIKKTAKLLLLAAVLNGLPISAHAQESILSIAQQREQAANQSNPPTRRNTTTKVDEIVTRPENISKDYGSKTSTRPQYVKGLKKPSKKDNTTIPSKKLKLVVPNQPKADLNTAAPGLPPVILPVRKKQIEADPYAPDGIRLGNINVLPFVGASGGYNTNPLGATKPKGSPLYQVEGGASLNSDWSNHAFNADLRGIYTDYTGVKGANQPEVSGKAGGRIDVTRDTKIDIETRARLSTESVSSINLPSGVTQRPNTYSYGSALGASQRMGNVVLSTQGSMDRFTYDPANVGSTIIDQSDRNQNTYALRLRAGYEVSPGITPFVDAIVDKRQFDKTIDRNGFKRESSGLTARAGTSFELTRTLTGEVAAGYGNREFTDRNLKSLNGLVADANLIWSVSPLTAIRLRAASELQDTTTAGASGVIYRRAGIDVEHALLRNLTLGASTEFGRSTSQGASEIQDSVTAGLRADYKLTKEIIFRTSYTFQKISANYSGGSYTSHLVLLGLRLQR